MIQTPITEMECVHFDTTKQPFKEDKLGGKWQWK